MRDFAEAGEDKNISIGKHKKVTNGLVFGKTRQNETKQNKTKPTADNSGYVVRREWEAYI